MKTKHKILMIISFIFIIGISLIYFKFGPMIKGKLYNGNRITLNVSIYVNDKELELQNVSAECSFENEVCNIKSENGKFQTKGGKYGEYCFKITIPSIERNTLTDDLILNLNFLNSNDWYISKSDCCIYLYTDNNSLSGNATINTKYNDNTVKTNVFDIDETTGDISLHWGL